MKIEDVRRALARRLTYVNPARFAALEMIVSKDRGFSFEVVVDEKPHLLSETDAQRVRQHLTELLATPPLASSRRCQAFLRYVVEETLAGRGPGIKERNIAVDVFAKGAGFDSQSESIVRVSAAELRRRLASAYADSEFGERVRIEIPVGTYQPDFHLAPPPAPEEVREVDSPSEEPKHGRGKTEYGKWRLIAVASLFALTVIVVTAALVRTGNRRPPLDLLWSSFANQDQPVLIALPSPMVVELVHPDRWLPLRPGKLIPADEMREKDLYYVGTGAAFGGARFGEQLAARHQSFSLKFGTDVSFSDLHQRSAILLGAYTSQWTMDMTQNLRFRFEKTEDWNTIVDSWRPGHVWRAPRRAASEPAETYSVITRLVNSDSGHPLLMAAGMDARGTQAAADFLTNPMYFDQFAKVVPADWPKRNFQVVLRAAIHGHSPGSPALIAWHEW